MEDQKPDNEVQFVTGAKRSEIAPFFDQLTEKFVRRLALRCTGAPKGDPPLVVGGFEYAGGSRGYGRGNWKNGMPMEDTFNHMIAHLWHWKRQIELGEVPKDDDLAAAAWAIQALMHFEQDYAEQHNTRIKKGPKPPAANLLIDWGEPHAPQKAEYRSGSNNPSYGCTYCSSAFDHGPFILSAAGVPATIFCSAVCVQMWLKEKK